MLNQKILDTKLMEHEIVEQGRSGGWTWRKWSDGTLEQWYQGNPGSYTINTARGSLYSGNTLTYAYPIAFVEYPTVVASVTLGTSAYVIFAQVSGLANESIDLRIISTASMAASTYFNVHIYAVGRWK